MAMKHELPQPHRQNDLPLRERLFWYATLAAICIPYFRYFGLDQGRNDFLAFLAAGQLVYFFAATRLPIPFALKITRRLLQVPVLVGLLIVQWFVTVLVLIIISLLTGALEFDLDFSAGNIIRIGNFFEIMWPYLSLASTWSMMFFFQMRDRAVYRENRGLLRKIEEKEQQLWELEARSYEQKMEPHMLNNLMTTYRSMIRTADPDDQEEALNHLIRIARYYVRQRDPGGLIPLHEELTYADHLLAVYRLALGGQRLYIQLDHPKEYRHLYILPALLLTLLKNMNKHGVLTERNYPARLELTVSDGHLHILAENYLRPDENGEREAHEETRAGLQILQARLQNHCPGAGMETSLTDGWYRHRIRIPLASLSPVSLPPADKKGRINE